MTAPDIYEEIPDTPCPLDTDGDGNCPAHIDCKTKEWRNKALRKEAHHEQPHPPADGTDQGHRI